MLRKILEEKKSSTSQEGEKGTNPPEDQRVTTEEVGNFMQGEKTEDNMWGSQGQADSDTDLRASEAGQQRLEALERELCSEVEYRQQGRARLRGEDPNKKLIQESEKHMSGEAKKEIKVIPPERRESPLAFHGNSSQIYLEVLQLAYRNGKLSKSEADILALLRQRFGLTEKEHNNLQQKVQLEIYSQAMVEAWKDGIVTREDVEKLDLLRERLNISAEDHLRLERKARRQELGRDVFGTQSDARV